MPEIPINRHLQRLSDIDKSHAIKSIGRYAFGYYHYDDRERNRKIAGFIIYGKTGSTAETYTKNNGFRFKTPFDYK